jgi:YidC/Oxa1 family membrane protein insertase
MDRRSLLFVICFGIIFVATQFYFGNQRDDEIRQEILITQQQEAKEKAALEKLVEDNSLSLDQLPVADVFLDKEGKQYLTKSYVNQGTLLVLGKESLPETVFISSSDNMSTQGPFNLVVQNFWEERSLAIYTSEQSEPLLPYLESYKSSAKEMFLIPIGQEDKKAIFAQSVESRIETPLKELKADHLVLVKAGKKFVPIGVVEQSSRLLYSLEDFKKIASLAKPMVFSDSKVEPEQNYVLETPLFQLVFSSKGAALSEINLALHDKEDDKSIVKPIEVDRYLEENSPQNIVFPFSGYWKIDKETKEPVYKATGETGGYYPLIRRSLELPQGPQVIPPQYYACNLVSSYPEVANQVYEMKYFDEKKIVFESVQAFRKITKTYEVDKDLPYSFSLSVNVEGDKKGLWITSGVPEAELVSGSSGALLQYRLTEKGSPKVEKVDLPKEAMKMTSTSPDWVSNSNGFFGVLMDPDDCRGGFQAEPVNGEIARSRLTLVDAEDNKYPPESYPGYLMKLPLDSSGSMNIRCYVGPYDVETLENVDANLAKIEGVKGKDYKDVISYYGFTSFISAPFSKLLDIVMKGCYWLTNSWVFSIFLSTLLLKVVLYPFNRWSMRSMRKMQEIGPQVTLIQKKFKKDPKRSQMEIMQLYKENKVNPLGGCLPILIQLPFLMGMLDLLRTSFPLRGASVFSGWIENLAAPDVVYSWGYAIPFIGKSLHLLPLILGALMFVQQRLMSPLPKDSSTWTDQQRQQRMMGNMMTFVLAFVFYHFPSGLNLYWLFSTLLGLLQQWWTNKTMPAVKATEVTGKIHSLKGSR